MEKSKESPETEIAEIINGELGDVYVAHVLVAKIDEWIKQATSLAYTEGYEEGYGKGKNEEHDTAYNEGYYKGKEEGRREERNRMEREIDNSYRLSYEEKRRLHQLL